VKYLYILITPVKNEEMHLPKVLEATVRQTVPPVLWIIVDDGSTDRTPEILENIKNRFDWIKSIQLPPHPRDITFHYSFVCKTGFDYALQFCETNAIQYNFIGLLYADTVLEETYFEKLSAEFDKNNRLGIISGHITDMPNIKIEWVDIKKNEPDRHLPFGSGRLWRKECFFETEGYPNEPSPDSISNVKAILKGWEIRQFGNIRAIQLRETSGAQGLWKGYRINGSTAYYLNKHPFLVILNALYISTQKPYYPGIPYFYGYLKSLFQRAPKISDIEIKNYFWHTRLYEYLPDIKFLKRYR
jgi:glycosyltransferase involved in cell wall biosynthesis